MIPVDLANEANDQFDYFGAWAEEVGVKLGSGLGLAIVKSIVAAHGGDVSADSADGITTFTLRLPLVIGRST